MIGLKYAPLKSKVSKKLPRVLFYKATGCKNAKCAKGAEGLYNAIDTKAGRFLGAFDVRFNNIHNVSYLDIDRSPLYDTLNAGYLWDGGKRKVKLPYTKEYESLYDIYSDIQSDIGQKGQMLFAQYSLALLKNISDKFKRPIVLTKSHVPNSMTLAAIESRNYVGIPEVRIGRYGYDPMRAIDGDEMGDRCLYLKHVKNGRENRYNEKTYKNVNKYLEKNGIDSLVYAEYAVHPKIKRPNLKTAIKEFFIDVKNCFKNT